MESSKNRVRVNIYGEEYTVRSDGNVEYIQEVARFVDEKMRELAEKMPNKSPGRVAVLTALNIADELIRARRMDEHSLSAVEKQAKNLISLLDEKISPADE